MNQINHMKKVHFMSDKRSVKSLCVKALVSKLVQGVFVLAVIIIAVLLVLVSTGTVSLRTSDTVSLRMDNIGELATQVAYYTNVQVIENNKEVFGHAVPFTKSKYIFSYDGILKAGVDFAEIDIAVDEPTHTITVKMPETRIISNEIDTSNMRIYDESRNIFSPLKMEDISVSFEALRQESEDKALSNGILENAKENVETLVTNFIASVYDSTEYTVIFE